MRIKFLESCSTQIARGESRRGALQYTTCRHLRFETLCGVEIPTFLCRAALFAGVLASACAAPSTVEVAVPAPPSIETVPSEYATLLEEAHAAVVAAPAEAMARGRLGMIHEVAGQERQAAARYDDAARLDSTDPRWPYHQARLLARQGQLEAAVASIDQAIELSPDSLTARLHRAHWLLDLARPDQALAEFEQAAAAAPDLPAARLGQARAHLDLGSPRAALALLEPMAGRSDRPRYVDQLLARAYRALGELERARAAMAQAGSPQPPPGWPDPWSAELNGYRRGLSALLGQAEQWLNEARYQEVIDLLEPVYLADPTERGLINGLTLAYRAKGRLAQALALLDEAVSRDDTDYEFLLRAAEIEAELGSYVNAGLRVDRALAVQPARAEAHLLQARLALRLGDRPTALDAFVSAAERAPTDPEPLLNAGLLQAAAGSWTEAVTSLRRAVSLAPQATVGWIALGGSLAELGQFEAAGQALARAETLAPQSPQLAVARARYEQLRSEGSN